MDDPHVGPHIAGDAAPTHGARGPSQVGGRRSVVEFERLVELSPDGILVHDGEHIVAVNAAFTRLTGAARRDQLVGHPIDGLLRPPHLKAVQGQLSGRIRNTELSPAVRDTLHRLDGRTVEVEVRAVVFLDGDRPSAHLVVRDITDRLAAEERTRDLATQLQRAQKTEAVGLLAGGVAHEVNNMLQVIMGFGGLLLDEPSASAACRDDAQQILTAAAHAASVTRQLLEYSRRASHHPLIVDLAAPTRRLEPVLQRLVGTERRFSIDYQPSVSCLMDEGQLEQVLVNLVLNARHATPIGGHISVVMGHAHIGAGLDAADGQPIPPGHYATLVVRDTGIGMDASTLSHIFEPFFTTKPRGEGTGLGLAAVYGILTQNGAAITVESTLSGGSTFSVYFPVTIAAPGGHHTAPSSGATDH